MSKIQKTVGLVVSLGLGLVLSGLTFGQSSAITAEIEARTAPAGTTCMAGDPCASAAVAVSSEPRSGEAVYSTACTTCHSSGVAGAPKLGTAADWAPRLEKGLETLYTNAIKGFNGMPPMGLCSTCSDAEMNAAVDYMLANSK